MLIAFTLDIRQLIEQNGLYIAYIAAFLLIVCAALIILSAETKKKDSIEQLKDTLKKSDAKYIPKNEEIIILDKKS